MFEAHNENEGDINSANAQVITRHIDYIELSVELNEFWAHWLKSENS